MAFLEAVKPLAPADLLFLDETGSHRAMARAEARAPRGQRAEATKPVNRGSRVTRLGALGLHGLGAAMTVDGLTDGDVWVAFLQDGLLPPLRPGHIVLMDNLKAHKVAGGRAACAEAEVAVLSLPPSSPDVSPIEECGSKVTTRLRAKAARTRDALEQAITEAFETMTAPDARGWFIHAGYCIGSN